MTASASAAFFPPSFTAVLTAGRYRVAIVFAGTVARYVSILPSIVQALVILPYTLFGKGLILDGGAGLHYALERFIAEVILSWELFFGRK